jgi:uncharacterized protein YqgV (UPF0045/DUF77 family)
MKDQEWKKNKINVAMQVLPQAGNILSYSLVDKAIEAIRQTGFTYMVCPFETVVECNFYELPVLLEKVHDACLNAGTEKMLTNLKIQVDFENDVTIGDKMNKYS